MSNGTRRWGRAPSVFGWGLALALAATGLAGCMGTVGVGAEIPVYGYPTARVEAVPVEIHTYPRVHYRGSYAYLVEGRWYYPTSGGWVVFRREPQELARFRVDYGRRTVRQPAYRAPRRPPPPGYAYPPPPPRRQYYRPY